MNKLQLGFINHWNHRKMRQARRHLEEMMIYHPPTERLRFDAIVAIWKLECEYQPGEFDGS